MRIGRMLPASLIAVFVLAVAAWAEVVQFTAPTGPNPVPYTWGDSIACEGTWSEGGAQLHYKIDLYSQKSGALPNYRGTDGDKMGASGTWVIDWNTQVENVPPGETNTFTLRAHLWKSANGMDMWTEEDVAVLNTQRVRRS